MSQQRFVEVVGPSGLRGSIDTAKWPLETPTGPRSQEHAAAPASVRIQLDDGREITVQREALRRIDGGRYTLEPSAGGGTPDADDSARRSATVIPVVAEELRISKRQVEGGGVRVRKVSREREEIVSPPLMHEQVTIDRVAIQREVSGPMPIREEDGVTIVPLVEEVVVVRKTWVLREEIRIKKQRFEAERPKRVTLRTEEAIVERLEPPEGGEGGQEPGGPTDARGSEVADQGKER